jgi:hypothetical protein
MLVCYHGHNGQHSIEGYLKSMAQRDFRPALKDKKVVAPWGDIIRAAIKGVAHSNIDIAGVGQTGHEDLPGMFIPARL